MLAPLMKWVEYDGVIGDLRWRENDRGREESGRVNYRGGKKVLRRWLLIKRYWMS